MNQSSRRSGMGRTIADAGTVVARRGKWRQGSSPVWTAPYPGRKERRMIRAGAIRSAWLVVALLALPAAHALAADYERHFIGDRALATPGTPAPGLLLMGGGDRNTAALRWFLDKAGNGHVVVLRASLGGEIGQEFHDEVGGVASVETFVFANRQAAHDRRL